MVDLIGSRISTTYTILTASEARRPGVRNNNHGRRLSDAVRSTFKEYNALNQGSLNGVVIALFVREERRYEAK